MNEYVIGGSRSGGAFNRFQGNIAAIYLYDRILTPLEKSAVKDYINYTWGIGHTLPTYSGSLVLKLESSQFNTTESGSTIGLWRDTSGYDNDFSYSWGDTRFKPIVDSSRPLNGNNTLKFDTSVLYSHNGTFLSASYESELFVIFIMPTNLYPPDYDHNGPMFAFGRYLGAGLATHPSWPGIWYENFGTTEPTRDLGTSYVIPTSSYAIYNIAVSGSQYTASLNDDILYMTNTNTASFTDPYFDGYTLGYSRAAIGRFWYGHIAAIYVYNKKLTNTERNEVNTYFQDKWGVSFPRSPDPVTIPPGLVDPYERPTAYLWYKADSIGASDGDSIATWDNSSTEYLGGLVDFPLFQTVYPSQRPTYKTDQINGLPAVYFTGSQYLNMTNNFKGTLAGSSFQGAELFILIKVDNDPSLSTSGSGIYNIGGSDSSERSYYPYTDSNIYSNFYSTTRKTVGNPSLPLTSWRLYNVESINGKWIARLDGAVIYSTTSNTYSDITDVWAVGMSKSGTSDESFLQGYIAEMLLYLVDTNETGNLGLTNTQREQVKSYFSYKYNLTLQS
jgi:hypothetical protein